MKPLVKVVKIDYEAVMLNTSVPVGEAKKSEDVVNDICAKKNFFDDFSAFPSSSTSSSTSKE